LSRERDETPPPTLPEAPVQRLVEPLRAFVQIEAASGVVLLLAGVTALALANSAVAESFLGLWKTRLTLGLGPFEMDCTLKHWIGDGLMAIFFFVIGLEVKRELVRGELRGLRQAALPMAAAAKAGVLGGSVVSDALGMLVLVLLPRASE